MSTFGIIITTVVVTLSIFLLIIAIIVKIGSELNANRRRMFNSEINFLDYNTGLSLQNRINLIENICKNNPTEVSKGGLIVLNHLRKYILN